MCDAMAAAAADDAVAADIICSLRGADLARWTPPWGKRAMETEEQVAAAELSWPAMARGKWSRRRSPSASASTAAGKGRFSARSSPPSPLDYSAGSGSLRSGASTNGGEDGAFCSPWHRRAVTAPTTTTKVGSIGRPQLTFQAPPPRPTGQRQRKKMFLAIHFTNAVGDALSPPAVRKGVRDEAGIRKANLRTKATKAVPAKKICFITKIACPRLPEVQQLVRSLAVENESLLEEMRALQRACSALSKENDKLEIRIEQSNSQNETELKERKGKQPLDQQQSPPDSFALPDLNLPAQDNAESSVHC